MHDTITSKKLWFCVGAIASIFGFALCAAKITLLSPMFDTFVGAVVAITGLFLTGNIANKWVAGREERLATETEAKVVVVKKQGLQEESPELDDAPIRKDE